MPRRRQTSLRRPRPAHWKRYVRSRRLRAWLFRILHNAYLNQRRAARLHPDPAALSPADLEPAAGGLRPVEHEVLVRAELRAVLAAFRSLPERYATPLYLAAVAGQSCAEVARELGVPIGTVMSLIHRARQMVLTRLAVDER